MKLSHPEKFNIEMGAKVLNHLTLHPESHLQVTVMNECGTRGCIAGWTCTFYGRGYWDLDHNKMDAAQIILGLDDHERQLFRGGLSEPAARRMLGSMVKQATRYRARIVRQAEREEEKRQRAHDRAARRQRWTMWTLPLPKFRRTKVCSPLPVAVEKRT